MAQKKNNNKSPSLNNKHKTKKHSSQKAQSGKSKVNNSAEAEFLKEEFANEYAEREMLIDDGVDEPTTLKEVDAPPIDLATDVNVDLSMELNDADGDSELQSIENIVLDEGYTLSLQPTFEENGTDGVDSADPDSAAVADDTDGITLVFHEAELAPESESEAESEASLDTSDDSELEIAEPEVTVEINEEMVGFNFREERLEVAEADGADTDEADAVAVDLSDGLKPMVEKSDAPNDESAEKDDAPLPESDEVHEKQKTKAKRSKKPKQPDSEEDGTTIVDAVAKEMENEARQTLMQRSLFTDSVEENGESPVEEQEISAEPDTDEGAEQATDGDVAVFEEQEELSEEQNTDTEEYKANESDSKSDTTTESDTGELFTEEEEYKRALAIRDNRLKKAKSVFDFIELLIFTLLAVLLVTTFFVRHSVVSGDSMQGTLEDGQRLLISDFMYKPECGDIIVVEDHTTQLKKPIVKRIIALGGQTVKIARHGVYVDGVLLDEPYVFTDGVIYEYDVTPSSALLENETLVVGYNYYELVVPEGELFVMGDHRNVSSDSRMIGTVREDAILGKVLVRITPFDEFKFFN